MTSGAQQQKPLAFLADIGEHPLAPQDGRERCGGRLRRRRDPPIQLRGEGGVSERVRLVVLAPLGLPTHAGAGAIALVLPMHG